MSEKEGIWHILINGVPEITVYDLDTAKMDFLDLAEEYKGSKVELVQVIATSDSEVTQGDKFLTGGYNVFNGKTGEAYTNVYTRSWYK